jgi:hypothetical protein
MIPKLPAEPIPEGDVTSVVPSLCIGLLYRFNGLRGPERDGRQTWSHHPGNYRLLRVGKHVRTWQDLVSYAGEGGRDDGHVYFVPLSDWISHFELIPGQRSEPRLEPPKPVETPVVVEKVAGFRSTGSGV